MDIVKFKITPKTIKIEVRNSNNYIFNFNKAVKVAYIQQNAVKKVLALY